MFCVSTLCPIDSMGQPLNLVKNEKTSNMFCGSTLCPIDSMGPPLNLVKTAKAASNMFCGNTVSHRFNGAALEPCKNCKSNQQHVLWKHIMSHRFNGAALEPCISGASYSMRTGWVCYVAVSDLIGYGLCRQTFSPAPLGFPRKLVKPIPSGPVSVP